MSTETTPRAPGGTKRTAATGLALFAGVLMVVAGVYHALVGIAAIIRDTVYVSTPNYLFSFDLTGWGWAHLVLGVLVAIAGVAVVQGQTWARVTGIALASLSLFANFMFLPYYPIWAILIIALDIVVIWALATYTREAI